MCKYLSLRGVRTTVLAAGVMGGVCCSRGEAGAMTADIVRWACVGSGVADGVGAPLRHCVWNLCLVLVCLWLGRARGPGCGAGRFFFATIFWQATNLLEQARMEVLQSYMYFGALLLWCC